MRLRGLTTISTGKMCLQYLSGTQQCQFLFIFLDGREEVWHRLAQGRHAGEESGTELLLEV
jgi:hypothetical protein